jgi:hypothetical protein
MATDLERAFAALKAKETVYTRYFEYYDGEQPLVYTAARLAEVFKNLNAYFAENWCAVVIDSARDRINLREFQMRKPGLQTHMDAIYQFSELSLESDEVHEAAMVTGEAFMIAWPDEEGQPDAYYNDPRLCHVFYDAQYPRRKRFATKWWVEDDETLRLNLYYPDRLEYYRTTTKEVTNPNAFQPIETAPNPYGTIPVFHFRSGQRKVRSDLNNVIPVQNGINKLLTDMMVVAEYAAFPQRYVISNAEVRGKLKNAPNEVWDLPAGDGMSQQTQAGQFAAANLDNYLKAIDNLATGISSITRTPKHYFFSVGSNLSGEALTAMESPLVKKAQDRIDRYVPEWQRLVAFMFAIENIQVNPLDIVPVFDQPETRQARTEAETRDLNVRAGMPLTTVLREEGWSESRIDQMLADKADEEKRRQSSLAQAMLDAQRRFDGGEQ